MLVTQFALLQLDKKLLIMLLFLLYIYVLVCVLYYVLFISFLNLYCFFNVFILEINHIIIWVT